MTNHSDEQGSEANNTDLFDGFRTHKAEHQSGQDSPRTGLVLFSFGRRGGFGKPADEHRSINVVA